MQDALPEHLAAPDGPLDRVLGAGDEGGGAAGRTGVAAVPVGAARAHAGTFSRRSWISSLAFLTAEEASAE